MHEEEFIADNMIKVGYARFQSTGDQPIVRGIGIGSYNHKIFSIGDNSNLLHAPKKTTHTKLFKPYLFIQPL